MKTRHKFGLLVAALALSLLAPSPVQAHGEKNKEHGKGDKEHGKKDKEHGEKNKGHGDRDNEEREERHQQRPSCRRSWSRQTTRK